MIHTNKIPEDIGDYLRYEDGKLFWTKQPADCIKIGDEAGTLSTLKGRIQIRFRNKLYYAHRIIWLLIKGEQPPKLIDHINNNTCDNRIENLREASYSENQYNVLKRKDNKSGVKGVFWCKRSKKWSARIKKNRKRIHVGYFTSLEDAEQAVKKARQELHEEFANNG